MSQDVNMNIMFSPRGVMMLAQTEHEVRGYKRTAHANSLQGVATEFITPERVKELCPIMEIRGPRYPVLGALWQPRGGTARHDAVAWGYARAATDLGVDIIQKCEVTAIERNGPGGRVFEVSTNGETVWRYDVGGEVFRCEARRRDGHEALLAFDRIVAGGEAVGGELGRAQSRCAQGGGGARFSFGPRTHGSLP